MAERFLPIELKIAKELKIKIKQIMTWSSNPIEPQEGEAIARVGGYYVAYKLKKRKLHV